MTIDDQIRSLTRQEIKVLYWRCKGEQNKQIALRYGKTSPKWVEGIMTGVYAKLGVDKKATKLERLDYLNKVIFGVVQRLLEGNDENLERWPLYGVRASVQKRGVIIYAEKEVDETPKEPDPQILAIVRIDQEGEDQDEEPEPEPEKGKTPESPTESFSYHPPSVTPNISRRGRGPIGTILTFLILGVLCFTGGLALYRQITNPAQRWALFPPRSTLTPSYTPEPTDTPGPPTDTPKPPPTNTQEITPTPYPFFREDFSKQISEKWRTIGNPVVTGNIGDGLFTGVLTTQHGDTGYIVTGNSAWSDYIVTIRAAMWMGSVAVGVRVQDIENYIAVICHQNGLCFWILVNDGETTRLAEGVFMSTDPLIITVKGEEITAIGKEGSNIYYDPMALSVPVKYREKYQNGGILLQVIDRVEVDYVDIEPLH